MCLPIIFEKKKKKKDEGVLVYEPNARTVVKLTGVKKENLPIVRMPQPVVYQQPQPAYYAPHQQPFFVQPYGTTPQSMVNGIPSFNITQPTFGTIGYTGYEALANQMAFAQGSNINEKQEMKPADDDPLRMYWVREEDGSWTQRNRLTIDSGDIGECRWYAMDGKFYAIRLPQ